ncbi:hypothetical protein PG993_004971 [Apiospora rasikravindrae]|uniref:Uncharacterized protein n=1 Tax=Apiospora rasikravindrae TaxID=990691 RepID=A0ABR1TEX3_9PEZI
MSLGDTSYRVPDIVCTAPSYALRTTEGTSTQESVSNDHNAGRSDTKNPTVFSCATESPRRSSPDEAEQRLSTGFCISAPVATTATTSAPEHHRPYPLSPEETDHYIRSLSTNDLIALSTKAQCELQERGRSFSSILSGVHGGGSGNNGAAEVEVTVAQDGGIGISSGRAYKEKRKHDDADSDNEEHGSVTATTEPQEHQKNKKQKSEQAVASHSDTDPAIYSTSALEESPSLLDLQLLRDETVKNKEGSANNQQLGREDATIKMESKSTTAITTAEAELLWINRALAADEAEDMDWHYVDEDCWMSPQPCCGDVFEMIDRGECH